LYVDLGRIDDARLHFTRMANEDFRDLPRDGYWLVTMATLAEVAAAIGDTERGGILYEQLTPYADRVAVASFAHGCDGAVARPLGLLATMLGRFAEAERHFERALALNARIGARLLVAHTERDYAALLERRGAPPDGDAARVRRERAVGVYRVLGLNHEIVRATPATAPNEAERKAASTIAAPNVLRREGAVWTAEFDGRSVRVRDSKGLRYLVELLRQPRRELHVIDLAGAAAVREGDATPLPDARARLAYRGRLADLQHELDEAEQHHDLGRQETLRAEIDAVAHELAGAYGFGQAAQHKGQAIERVRKAVTKCIRSDIGRVAELHETLGRHLTNSIRTGTFCAYVPERPTDWQL
jgi:hypothetical protein